MTKYIAFLGLFNEQFYKKLAKDGNQFLAATAAQEAHLSIRPSVRPSVTCFKVCNFWHLLATFGQRCVVSAMGVVHLCNTATL